MPSLKDLRVRIRSVRSTQKITAAMKVVAASRLRRAQEQAEAARPYAQRMERVLASLAARMAGLPNAPPLLVGTGKRRHASDRRRNLGPRPRRRFQRHDPARGAPPHPRARGRRQAGHDPDHRAQGPRRPAPRLWAADPRQPDRDRPPPAVVRRGPRHRRAHPGAVSRGMRSMRARSSTTVFARRSPRSSRCSS